MRKFFRFCEFWHDVHSGRYPTTILTDFPNMAEQKKRWVFVQVNLKAGERPEKAEIPHMQLLSGLADFRPRLKSRKSEFRRVETQVGIYPTLHTKAENGPFKPE